jgi:hypothetical protein
MSPPASHSELEHLKDFYITYPAGCTGIDEPKVGQLIAESSGCNDFRALHMCLGYDIRLVQWRRNKSCHTCSFLPLAAVAPVYAIHCLLNSLLLCVFLLFHCVQSECFKQAEFLLRSRIGSPLSQI